MKMQAPTQRHDGANPVYFEARDLFPGLEYEGKCPIFGWDKEPEGKEVFRQKLVENYIPSRKVVQQIGISLIDGTPLCLVGPQGSGKTTALLEVAVRANWDVAVMTCNRFSEPMDLCGTRFQDENGCWRYEANELLDSYMNGKLLIMEERDTLNPATQSFLNPFLDRTPVRVPFLNGPAAPHANFRVFGTANTAGNGDGIDVFTASEISSPATNRRWAMWHMPYISVEEERAAVDRAFADGEVNGVIKDLLVRFARSTREAAEQGTVTAFSTGELMMCCTRIALAGPKALHECLSACYFTKLRAEQRVAAQEMFSLIAGDEFQPLTGESND